MWGAAVGMKPGEVERLVLVISRQKAATKLSRFSAVMRPPVCTDSTHRSDHIGALSKLTVQTGIRYGADIQGVLFRAANVRFRAESGRKLLIAATAAHSHKRSLTAYRVRQIYAAFGYAADKASSIIASKLVGWGCRSTSRHHWSVPGYLKNHLIRLDTPIHHCCNSRID